MENTERWKVREERIGKHGGHGGGGLRRNGEMEAKENAVGNTEHTEEEDSEDAERWRLRKGAVGNTEGTEGEGSEGTERKGGTRLKTRRTRSVRTLRAGREERK